MEFAYSGKNLQELWELVDPKKVIRGFSRSQYLTCEMYSIGRYIKNYGYYPAFLPLYCYSSHGVRFEGKAAPHELYNDSYAHLAFSAPCVADFQKFSRKPCYCVLSPFVWYRRKYKLAQSPKAKGLLVFPAHSTPDIDILESVATTDKYIADLKRLPAKYHPICVCLFMTDIYKGEHDIYIKNGFSVYTAGHVSDVRFVQRWYDLVRHFKYTSSQIVGSYTAYSTEMSIPFFLYGDDPKFYNKTDRNIAKGAYNFTGTKLYQEQAELFKEQLDAVSGAQREFAELHLGINDGISRMALAKVLYAAYWKQGRSLANLRQDLRMAWRYILRSLHSLRRRIFKTKKN